MISLRLRSGIPTVSQLEVHAFETTNSFLLKHPACFRLADPVAASEYFNALTYCDSISSITEEMWAILTDVGLWETYRIRIPNQVRSSMELLFLPPNVSKLFLFDKQSAQIFSSDITNRHLNKNLQSTIFDAYEFHVPDGLAKERAAMEFLARQVDHLDNYEDYLLVVLQNCGG